MVSDGPAKKVQQYAHVRIESKPPGASIFINGEPSGVVTPARVQTLPVGTEVEIHVQKAGYSGPPKRFVADGRKEVVLSFVLTQTAQRIKIVDMPPGARLYVDGREVDAYRSILLPFGKHVLRVESGGDLLVERSVEIRPDTTSVQLFEGTR